MVPPVPRIRNFYSGVSGCRRLCRGGAKPVSSSCETPTINIPVDSDREENISGRRVSFEKERNLWEESKGRTEGETSSHRGRINAFISVNRRLVGDKRGMKEKERERERERRGCNASVTLWLVDYRRYSSRSSGNLIIRLPIGFYDFLVHADPDKGARLWPHPGR